MISPGKIRSLASQAEFGRKTPACGKNGLVVCSHPIATQVGIEVLRAGGNACDAVLAIALAQTVVEPHMTTITGVFGLLYHNAASRETVYLNASVNAPLAPLPGFGLHDAETGRGVAVPGWWAGFEAALARWGTKPKAELMQYAIQLAEDGFPIHPFLYGEMFAMIATLGRTAEGRSMYMPEGALLNPGQTLLQPLAARTLRRLQEEGNEYFYRGEFADKLVEIVRDAGGVLTREDLERYEAQMQEPAWGTYHDYRLAGSPPPDNGGMHIIEALNMVEQLDLPAMGHPTESVDSLYYLMRISELVKEDGARNTDPETHEVPVEMLVSKEYADVRLQLLKMGMAPVQVKTDAAYPGTNHVTVVDAAGNVASLTHSCSSLPWSNGLFCEGISICAAGMHFMRHMPGPGERCTKAIVSSMVFDGDALVLACGSPSVSIIANVLQNTVNLLDFGMSIEESVHVPRFGNVYEGGQMIEADIDEGLRNEVERRGIKLKVVNPWNFHMGSFEGIVIDPTTGQARACADPRRAGMAMAV